MISINLTTLKGQQLAAKYLYDGWLVVSFQSDSITLQSPSDAQEN